MFPIDMQTDVDNDASVFRHYGAIAKSEIPTVWPWN